MENIWTYDKSKQNKKSRRLNMLKDGDKNIYVEYNMANSFNNYFTEIASKISQNIPRSNKFVNSAVGGLAIRGDQLTPNLYIWHQVWLCSP